MKRLLSVRSVAILLALFLAGCAAAGRPGSGSPEAAVVESLEREGALPAGAAQVLLVSGRDPSPSALVFALEKKDGKWSEALPPIPSAIGRSGLAAPGEKREGDGRTPSGVFRLERAFGYGSAAPTRLQYRQATEEDLWVDDPSSPDYNRWVRRGETSAASYEEMRRRDDQYKYGIVIEYNTRPVVPGRGSAIFFHIWKGEGRPTAGCVAMAEEDLLKVLGWLDPAKRPVAVLGMEAALR